MPFKPLLTILFILISIQVDFAQDGSRPNIILILADDLGYSDLTCYGATDLQTPELDKLASQGVRFTQFYANGPECTPTRTALLTGRYQQRVGGLECAIGLGNIGRYDEAKVLSDKGQLGLPTDFNVLPKILNDKGYQTALIGKWHLGEGEDFAPVAHGFDYSIGPLGGAVDYFHHTEPIGEFVGTYMHGDRDFYRNGVPQNREGHYLTRLITDEAIAWIDQQEPDQPFFLYLPYTTPHNPLQRPDSYTDEPITVDDWRAGDRSDYIAMVEDFDKDIGKILEKLNDKGMEENTLVIFFSDNGPTGKGSAGPYRGYKGHVFEGGIRVPCIIRWPGKIDPNITSSQAFISMDVTASIAEIINTQPHADLDGIDLIAHVISESSEFDRILFWRKKRGEQIRSAVRAGNMKYIRDVDGIEIDEYLFDLENDSSERNNLAATRKTDLSYMRGLLDKWAEEVQPERYE